MPGQPDLFSQLAGSGVFAGGGQPGGDRLFGVFGSLKIQGPFHGCTPLSPNRTMPGIFGIFSNGGVFTPRGNQAFKTAVAEAQQFLSKCNSEGVAFMQAAAGDIRSVSPEEILGRASSGFGRGGGGFDISHG